MGRDLLSDLNQPLGSELLQGSHHTQNQGHSAHQHDGAQGIPLASSHPSELLASRFPNRNVEEVESLSTSSFCSCPPVSSPIGPEFSDLHPFRWRKLFVAGQM